MNTYLKTFTFCLITALQFAACEDDMSEPCIATLESDCICTHQYDPVCGCDNVTYGNACAAACNNITDVIPGECP